MCAQSFGYDIIHNISAPDVKDVKEISRGVSTIFRDNPMYIIAPFTVCLLGGAIFKNRHKFSHAQLGVERINRVHGEVEFKVINNLLKFQNACGNGMDACVDTMPIPIFAREGTKSGLRYVGSGIINFLPFNKKFLAAAFCFWGAGSIIPFSNVFVGLSLLAGFANGLRQDLKKYIEGSTKRILDNIASVSGEVTKVQLGLKSLTSTVTQGFLDAETNSKKASKEILDKIHSEGLTVANNVTRDVNAHVDKKLIELFTEINGLTKKCVDLSNGVSEVKQTNGAVVKAIKELEDELLKMREDFSSVLAESVAKMDASTKESAEMLRNMGLMGEAQDTKIASLITEVTNNNKLLSALSMIQSESGQALAALQENRAIDSNLLQKLLNKQEESDLHFVKKISSLQEQNKTFETSLNTSLDILSQRVGALERGQIEIKSSVGLIAKNQDRQFEVNQVLFQQQAQENQALHQEISKLKELVEVKTLHIESLKVLLTKLDNRLKMVEGQTACLPEIHKNTEENTEHLRAIRYQSRPQHPSLLQEEQASIDSGLAVPLHSFNPRLNEPQLPLDLSKFKTTPGFFRALTYNPADS